jgi:uncharacterized protein YtpQ (UPF0354 family)
MTTLPDFYAPESGEDMGNVVMVNVGTATPTEIREYAKRLTEAADHAASYLTKVRDDDPQGNTFVFENLSGGWDGSFYRGLCALIEDLLSDGAPFDGMIGYLDHNRGTKMCADGFIKTFADGKVVFLDGHTVEVDTIYRLELEG